MPGRGFPVAPEDTDHAAREVRGWRSLWTCAHLDSVVATIQRGITSFSDYEAVLKSFRALQAELPGFLGEYHLKLAMDHMVATRLLPPRWVSEWPVSPSAGTASGLRRLFRSTTRNPQVLRKMLSEL